MEQVCEEVKIRTTYDKDWVVVMYNDNTTPINLVVDTLIEVFNYSYNKAIKLAYEINDNDKGIVGSYPKKLALARSKKAEQRVHTLGYTDFRVRAEES